ncbi:hypothetical protein D8S78_24285 [Natrialba swarupiae]|nr:hypothetical protein [Natrialba swarupiae]
MTTSVLAASFNDDGTIEDSSATGEITGDFAVGGLVGENFHGTIEDSSTTTDVDGNSDVGGLVGQNSYGEIRGPQPPTMSTATVERAACWVERRWHNRELPPPAMSTVSAWLAVSSA